MRSKTYTVTNTYIYLYPLSPNPALTEDTKRTLHPCKLSSGQLLGSFSSTIGMDTGTLLMLWVVQAPSFLESQKHKTFSVALRKVNSSTCSLSSFVCSFFFVIAFCGGRGELISAIFPQFPQINAISAIFHNLPQSFHNFPLSAIFVIELEMEAI